MKGGRSLAGFCSLERLEARTWTLSALRCATSATAPVMVLAPDPVTELPITVTELLTEVSLDIGAVVPMVMSPAGRLLQAGTEINAGALVAVGAGHDPSASRFLMRRDVPGTTYPWVAVRRELITSAGLNPMSGDLQDLIDALLANATTTGLRIAYEPSWAVTAEPPDPAPTPYPAATSAPRGEGDDLLIVSAFVPGDPFRAEDRSVWALVADLAEQIEGARITFVAVDGFRAEPGSAKLRHMGIEVVCGPMDWSAWCAANISRFTHVFCTWSGLQSDVWTWIRRTQGQAINVLHLPRLPFLDVESLRAQTPAEELDGLECVRSAAETRLVDLAGWLDAIWCEREADAAFLRGLRRFPVVSVVPPALAEPPPVTEPTEPDDREGLVIVAAEGHDVVKANEEAALFCLAQLLPALRRRRPGLACTVLSDAPSPRLDTGCRTAGATLVPLEQAAGAMAGAAVTLVGHQFGTGGQVAILASLEARTPFVTTPAGATGVELGSLAPLAVFGAAHDLIYHVEQLLNGGDARRRFGAEIDRLAIGTMSKPNRSGRLRDALPCLGLTPALRPGPRWTRQAASVRPAPLVPFIALRPPAPREEFPDLDPDPGAGPGPESETDRYIEWSRRFGPNEANLQSLRLAVQDLQFRPLVSILMPVYNSHAATLREAINSVTTQIYTNWQLCIADDGSDRPETRAVLDEVADDIRITITRRPGRAGDAGATNAAFALAAGEFVVFLDHNHQLKPHALAQVIRLLNAERSLDIVYTDEDKLDEQGRLAQPQLKPDWSPDLLRSTNYVGHLTLMRRALVADLGGLRSDFDGSHNYDLVLRATERTDRIAHIPEPLYTTRVIPGSDGATPDIEPHTLTSAKRALEASLERQHLRGTIEETPWPGRFRTRYALAGQPKVSIIIPTRNGVHLLRRCIGSILEKTSYRNYDLVIIDNLSTDGDALGYLASLPARVISYPYRFNYSRMLNLAASTTDCDALLFLNNDTEVITADWIEALLEHAMRPQVGATGARLYFCDGRIQHEGIHVGVGPDAWAMNIDHGGYRVLGDTVRNTSAVTGACTMMRPSVYWRLGGNDERLRVAYNDVDICLRVHQAGLEVVYTPYAELFHDESSTRSGYEHEDDRPLLGLRWEPPQRLDRYYSPLFESDGSYRIGLCPPNPSRRIP